MAALGITKKVYVAPLAELLDDFAGVVSGMASSAPDEYPEWSYDSYESQVADIQQLWSAIRPRLNRDLAEAAFVDQKLQEALQAFREERKDTGRNAMWAIYNLGVKELR